MNKYILSQTGNADETPMYFNFPSNYTIDVGAKSVGNEKTENENIELSH
jgi:hypothetical protein